jgi:hypothetical protein
MKEGFCGFHFEGNVMLTVFLMLLLTTAGVLPIIHDPPANSALA